MSESDNLKNIFTELTLKGRFWQYAKYITSDSYVVDFENKNQLNEILGIMEAGEKGVVLCGKTGSGKTFIFQILQKIFLPQFHPNKMALKHVNEVVAIYEKQGDEGLFALKNNSICFDELGREKNGKFFGSEQDVMQMLISHRYNLWKYENKLTFFTSNYSKADLEIRYGTHSMSRLQEMCVFINLGVSIGHTDRRVNATKLIHGFPEVMPRYIANPVVKLSPEEKEEQKKINQNGIEKITSMLADKMKDKDGK